MKQFIIKVFLSTFAITVFFLVGCKEDTPDIKVDDFDRSTMLTSWADDFIMPAYENYISKLNSLKSANDAFVLNANQENLEALRTAFIEAYLNWQDVSMFEIGKAEEISLRNYTNIYPADISGIQNNISNTYINLELPSTFDMQGFPAMDYLLFGYFDEQQNPLLLAEGQEQIYFARLIDRLIDLTTSVLSDWQNGYRETFISNSTSSATGSVDKLSNDVVFYYEKFLRAGKVGIPAGVFSGNTIANNVEAPYGEIYSKALLLRALNNYQNFFNGEKYNASGNGLSFSDYLIYLNTIKNGADLSSIINNEFDEAIAKVSSLDDNVKEQIQTDNITVLEAYEELQDLVVLLKVDMFQAFNISVDYVDADGD